MIQGLSIIIPAYNEEVRIAEPVRKLRDYLQNNASDFEVLIVDDGSKDGTANVVEKNISGWGQARLVRLQKNVGKGGAIQKGVQEASKSIVCFMDADLSTDLEMLPRLYKEISNQTPVVIGSRAVQGSQVEISQNFFRKYFAKVLNLWIQLWALPGIWDSQCGFKFFQANAAKEIFGPLRELRFGFDIEILYRARKKGYAIKEVPVKWSNVEGTKVSPVKDGLSIAWLVVRLRCSRIS